MNDIRRLTSIYHETQEGALCAQHALNNLLQNDYFSAVDLATIAHQLDEQERIVVGLADHESQNMDDTGFFSIQVLQNAVAKFQLELIPYASQHPLAKAAREHPQSIIAYICNLREHWFTIRRFGSQYFDLNSVFTAPKLISDTYLSLYLAQLQQSGYSIFIVNGVLAPCAADEKLTKQPVDPTIYRTLTERSTQKTSTVTATDVTDDDQLQEAIKASMALDNAQDRALQQVLAQSLREVPMDENDDELQQAISMSLVTENTPSVQELRERRLQFFEKRTFSHENNK